MSAENYYEVLGLKRGAADEAVKQAFRDLAKTLHPDLNPGDPEAERRFKLITTAYEALKDESRRRAYDEWLAFARKHERSRFAQWGRLAALIALLVIGPSLALYWASIFLQSPAPSQNVASAPSASAPEGDADRAPAPSRQPAPARSTAQPDIPLPSQRPEVPAAAVTPPPPAAIPPKPETPPVAAKPDPAPQAQPRTEGLASRQDTPSLPSRTENGAARPETPAATIRAEPVTPAPAPKPETPAAVAKAEPPAPVIEPPAAKPRPSDIVVLAEPPASAPKPEPPAARSEAAPPQPPAARFEPAPQLPAATRAGPPAQPEAPRNAPSDLAGDQPAPQSPAPRIATPQEPKQSASPAESTASVNPPADRTVRPSLRELAGAEERASASERGSTGDNPRQSAASSPNRTPPQTPSPPAENTQESASRNMARMIAELKEQTRPLRDQLPSSGLPAERGEREAAIAREQASFPRSRNQTLGPDDFSDCEGCPVMSLVATREIMDRGPPRRSRGLARSLAISKYEVTVREWNDCVADGVCRRSRDGSGAKGNQPVRNVAPEEAADYAHWLTDKTGKLYRLLKPGGWARAASPRRGDEEDEEAGLRRGEPGYRPGQNLDDDMSPEPFHTTSGFRVTRIGGPDG